MKSCLDCKYCKVPDYTSNYNHDYEFICNKKRRYFNYGIIQSIKSLICLHYEREVKENGKD